MGGAEQAAGPATHALSPVVRRPGPPTAMPAALAAMAGAPARAAAAVAGQDGTPRAYLNEISFLRLNLSEASRHILEKKHKNTIVDLN
ncbi:hypothetical protein LguiB_017875 [Lonicera macranthoides]